MRNAKIALSLGVLLALTACSNQKLTAKNNAPNEHVTPQIIAPSLAALSAESCPETVRFVNAQQIAINIAAVDIPAGTKGMALDGAELIGLWHITSDEPNFGGLSGLSTQRSGTLLTVSDNGAFVWIGMDNGAPDGLGSIAYMRDETGNVFDGKSLVDAEGLELTEAGLALVSFERNARVLAFDLERCGSAARGALIADIPERPDGLGKSIPENQGPEALMIDPAGFLAGGLETSSGNQAAIGKISPSTVSFDERINRPNGTTLVGLDTLDNTVFALFRGYSPLTGNKIVLHAYENGSTEPTELASLQRPFPVDNFEGITATRLPDGTVRLYIVSDDNFSDRQRTLLMAFDVAANSGGN